MKEILIVLGSPNTPEGELMKIAIDRLNACLELFNKDLNLVLCTGGFGAHFNTTKIPHAQYAVNYLEKRGIPKTHILDIALAANTVDDAVKAKVIISEFNFPLRVITSEYHLKRVKIIFEAVLPDFRKEYLGIHHNLPKHEMDKLVEHETKSVAGLIKNGVYF